MDELRGNGLLVVQVFSFVSFLLVLTLPCVSFLLVQNYLKLKFFFFASASLVFLCLFDHGLKATTSCFSFLYIQAHPGPFLSPHVSKLLEAFVFLLLPLASASLLFLCFLLMA
jgi:hypothetical protein